jgi:hypothetical protein
MFEEKWVDFEEKWVDFEEKWLDFEEKWLDIEERGGIFEIEEQWICLEKWVDF